MKRIEHGWFWSLGALGLAIGKRDSVATDASPHKHQNKTPRSTETVNPGAFLRAKSEPANPID
jgi:hypothetical protein